MSSAPVETSELVGFWSVEYGFHSSMEDECLMLRADETAWYVYERPGFREFTLFRWRLVSAGLVEARAYEQVTQDDGETQHRPLDTVERVAVSIGLAQRPLLDVPVRELSLRLSFALTAPFAYVRADEPTNGPAART